MNATMNATILLANKTKARQRIFTEPWGESIDLFPGEEAVIEFRPAPGMQQSIGLLMKADVWILYPADGELIAIYVNGEERARYD